MAQNCLLECGPLGRGNHFPTRPAAPCRLLGGVVAGARAQKAPHGGQALSWPTGTHRSSHKQRRPGARSGSGTGDPRALVGKSRRNLEAVTHLLCIATVSITVRLPGPAASSLPPRERPDIQEAVKVPACEREGDSASPTPCSPLLPKCPF